MNGPQDSSTARTNTWLCLGGAVVLEVPPLLSICHRRIPMQAEKDQNFRACGAHFVTPRRGCALRGRRKILANATDQGGATSHPPAGGEVKGKGAG